MKIRKPEYECQAFPDGTWNVRYIHRGGERAETVGSGKITADRIPIRKSLLESAELAARRFVEQRKREAAEQARLREGSVTFTITA